jgi:hypothetical protein
MVPLWLIQRQRGRELACCRCSTCGDCGRLVESRGDGKFAAITACTGLGEKGTKKKERKRRIGLTREHARARYAGNIT